MAPGDLVTLSAAKNWLGITDNKVNADQLLTRLIRAASAYVLNYLNRNSGFAYQLVTNRVDGTGKDYMLLRESPVIDVVSIDLGNGNSPIAVSTGSPPSNGYLLEDESTTGAQQRLTLVGNCFPLGRSNVVVSYHTGFRVLDEAQSIPPVTGPYTITPFMSWIGDMGVNFASGGVALTKVTGAPAASQYAVADGVYTFNVADAGKGVLIDYSFCPEDVAQAVLELVGERYKVTSHIGEVSHAMGGSANTTTAYSQKDMNDTIKSLLSAYRKVTMA